MLLFQRAALFGEPKRPPSRRERTRERLVRKFQRAVVFDRVPHRGFRAQKHLVKFRAFVVVGRAQPGKKPQPGKFPILPRLPPHDLVVGIHPLEPADCPRGEPAKNRACAVCIQYELVRPRLFPEVEQVDGIPAADVNAVRRGDLRRDLLHIHFAVHQKRHFRLDIEHRSVGLAEAVKVRHAVVARRAEKEGVGPPLPRARFRKLRDIAVDFQCRFVSDFSAADGDQFSHSSSSLKICSAVSPFSSSCSATLACGTNASPIPSPRTGSARPRAA